MEADVLEAIRSQLAYLSGSRQAPILIINAATAADAPTTTNKTTLELCLNYLVSILR